MLIRNLSLAVGVLAISTTVFGQKKNETTASMERNAAVNAMVSGDMEAAKRRYLSAKEYIDLAAAHEDTKNNQKTLWLVGDIYTGILSLGMQNKDMDLITSVGEDGMAKAIASLKKAYPLGSKFETEITETVNRGRYGMEVAATMMYNQKMYTEAAKFYSAQADLRECVGVMDTLAVFNLALSLDKSEQYEKAAIQYMRAAKVGHNGTIGYVYASSAYRNAGMPEKAAELIKAARVLHPTDKDLLLETVNAHLAAGNNAEAEKALTDAIATDPNNKQLHYTIGTIMIELGKNEEAETALNKALSIDPNYVDAQYQLGAHLVTWASSIKTEASKLGPNETAKYNELDKQSDETFKRALIPLEKYIAAYPNDKNVLTILFQIHRNLGDSAKALEFKRRADAAE